MAERSSRDQLRKRLSKYWKLEIANAVLIPAFVIYFAYTGGGDLGLLTWFSFLPMCGLLVVGGLYWRGKLHALGKRPDSLRSSLGIAHKFQTVLLISSVSAIGLAAASWFVPTLSVSFADRLAASVCAVLAGLEYVNYYHRQLQHFDHAADFMRLMTGGGFRKAQMAVDLERYRAKMR